MTDKTINKAAYKQAALQIAAGKSVHALTVGRLAEALNVSVEYLLGV